MLTVRTAQAAKMKYKMTPPYQSWNMRPLRKTIIHRTSDNSKRKWIEVVCEQTQQKTKILREWAKLSAHKRRYEAV